jgi:hypothetical protein
MLDRRQLLSLIPPSILAWLTASPNAEAGAPNEKRAGKSLLVSPPVVQHPAVDGFVVSFAVSRLATGWVEWGLSAETLDRRAEVSYRGLVAASDRVLMVPVVLGDRSGAGRRIYYRVVARPLTWRSTYQIERGPAVAGSVRSVVMPDPAATKACVAVVNDTHQHPGSLVPLASRIERLSPDVLVWNGDACSSGFNTADDIPRILLTPGAKPHAPAEGGWASTRPLLFVLGNHELFGEHARELRDCLAPGPDADAPYNFALRHGPLALIGLDTGQGKRDDDPSYAGTVACEPYRVHQSQWLRSVLKRPEIASAPHKVAFCHIPLRGLPGQSDGLSRNSGAMWSGDGARLWLPILREAGVQLVVSGHQHAWHVIEPCDGLPMQVIGGGNEPYNATLIVLEANATSLRVVIQDLAGTELAQRRLTRS